MSISSLMGPTFVTPLVASNSTESLVLPAAF